tara:strand:- start:130 stop:1338 length:1209 start_codon:yes stop_codon:yes gene_type:complete
MTRKEFIEKSLMMGISLPFLSSMLGSFYRNEHLFLPPSSANFKGKVIIIGAGAAGMSAGYLLKSLGVDFEILEATPIYGGRLKKAANFADFPIDLGAEWIHVEPEILKEIAQKPTIESRFETITYNPQSIQSWKNGKLKSHNYIKSFYSEWKFKGSTWFDFFEQNIVAEISDKILVNKPVVEINYASDKVLVKTADQQTYEADKVLLTIPIKVLQNETLTFQPHLPPEKKKALNSVFMGDGIKIFIEFKERFYPDILAFGNIFKALTEEEKFVYDAAFKKDSSKNILGLFAINEKASAYTQLESEEKIIAKFLGELDEMFEGQASSNYINHIIQNWSKEPYIQGSYSYSFEANEKDIINTLAEPIKGKVYFAGEALSIDNRAMVQGACESAYNTVATMMKNT